MYASIGSILVLSATLLKKKGGVNTAAKRMRMRKLRLFPVCRWCSFQINFVVCLAVFKACCCESAATD